MPTTNNNWQIVKFTYYLCWWLSICIIICASDCTRHQSQSLSAAACRPTRRETARTHVTSCYRNSFNQCPPPFNQHYVEDHGNMITYTRLKWVMWRWLSLLLGSSLSGHYLEKSLQLRYASRRLSSLYSNWQRAYWSDTVVNERLAMCFKLSHVTTTFGSLTSDMQRPAN